MIKYLRVIFFDGWIILYSYFAWMIRYSNNPSKYPLEKRYKKIRFLVLRVLKHFHVEFNKINTDSYINTKKDDSCLIVSNHLSDIDPLIFIALSEKPVTFAAKDSVKHYPLIGRVLRILEGAFLDRNDLKQQLKEMKRIENSLANNKNLDWVIFPEGTRNKKPYEDILPLHHGTFRPAFKSNKNIYIFTIFGTFRVLDIHSKYNKNPVEVKYISKFDTNDFKNETTASLADKTYNYINNEIKELRKIDNELLKKLND